MAFPPQRRLHVDPCPGHNVDANAIPTSSKVSHVSRPLLIEIHFSSLLHTCGRSTPDS